MGNHLNDIESPRNWGAVFSINILFALFMLFSTKNLLYIAIGFMVIESIVLYYSTRVISLSNDRIIYSTLLGKEEITWGNVSQIDIYNGFTGKNFFYVERNNGKRMKGYWDQQFKKELLSMCAYKKIRVNDAHESWKKN